MHDPERLLLEKVDTGQGEHASEPGREKVPGAQTPPQMLERTCPGLGLVAKVPAAHGVQLVALLMLLKVAGGHCWHARREPMGLNLPPPHQVQPRDMGSEAPMDGLLSKPCGHSRHTDRPTEGAREAPSQAWQEPCPETAAVPCSQVLHARVMKS